MLSATPRCASVRNFLLSTLLLALCPLFAQISKSSALPRFEVADIHSSPDYRYPYMSGGVIPGRRFVIEHATMLGLIAYAYGVQMDHILGGPSSLDWNRFDIYAKMSATASSRDTKGMVQSLLTERFHLKIHPDVKPIPAYVLRVDKSGWKFKPADPSEASGIDQTFVSGNLVYKFHNEPIHSIVYAIGDTGTGYVPQPVVDQTGLTDRYDFELRWTYNPRSDGISLFDALEKQLGLKLTMETAPAPVLVVDSVDEEPTPNRPDLDKLLPPRVAEFEVASVRPSRPGEQSTGNMRTDQFTEHGIAAHWLLVDAWDVNEKMIVNEPKWAADAKYDVQAEVPADFILSFDVHGDRPAPRLGLNDRTLMLQTLLRDRFQLQMHWEERPGEGYVLFAASPRMKKADATERTECIDGPAVGDKDPRAENPQIDAVITCRNITMKQFLRVLWIEAPGYIVSPVLDQSGLQGGYDFTLAYSGARRFQAQGPAQQGSDGTESTEAPEANAPISLFTAMQKQLGLKLQNQKRPVPVLVIDHMEKPTEN